MANRLVRTTSLAICGLLALTLAAGPVRAAPDEPLNLRYGLYWAGIRIATLALQHQVQPGGYQSELDIKTVGLLEHLVHYRSSATAIGQRDAAEGLMPVTYRSEYRTRKKNRRAVVKFDPASGDVVDLKSTKWGEPDKSKVPEALRAGVTDPLTAFLRVRDHVAATGGSTPFTAAVFDGRRRFDLEAKVIGRDRARVAGQDQPVIRVGLTLTFRAGSDLDDASAAAADDDRFELELLLSDDARLLPLQMRTRDSLITGTIELLQDCSRDADCQVAAAR